MLELWFIPVLLPCEPCERPPGFPGLAFAPPISLLFAIVRPLKPAPLRALLLFDELDSLIAAVPPVRVREREMLSLLEIPISALFREP